MAYLEIYIWWNFIGGISTSYQTYDILWPSHNWCQKFSFTTHPLQYCQYRQESPKYSLLFCYWFESIEWFTSLHSWVVYKLLIDESNPGIVVLRLWSSDQTRGGGIFLFMPAWGPLLLRSDFLWIRFLHFECSQGYQNREGSVTSSKGPSINDIRIFHYSLPWLSIGFWIFYHSMP